MSWSKSYFGKKAALQSAVAALAAELMSDARSEAEQIARMGSAHAVVGAIESCHIGDADYSVSAYGHTNEDGSGNVGVNIEFKFPEPVADTPVEPDVIEETTVVKDNLPPVESGPSETDIAHAEEVAERSKRKKKNSDAEDDGN